MLEGLDGLDWKSVQHAYGPATEVPSWLRAIAKESKRGKAFSDLVNAVNHQGTATPAAIHTVPFLLELVAAGAGPVADLTTLLGDLAAAGDHTNVLRFGAEVVRGHEDGEALSAAVLAGLDVFRRLMGHADVKVRAAATVPLTMLGDSDGETSRVLEAAIDAEPKPEALASFLLALAWLARERRGPSAAEALSRIDAHAKHKAIAVRVAAAIGGSWLDASPARARALAAIVRKAPQGTAVPFGQGDLRGLAVAEIARGITSGDVDDFLAMNDELDLFDERELYDVVLAAIAPELSKAPIEPPLATDFSEEQRRVLVLLAKRVVERSKDAHVPLDAFHERGIIAPVRLFGEVERRLPLDEAIDGEPLWRYARRARDGRIDASEWSAVVKCWTQGDAEKCAALAQDCFANGHVLSMPYPYVYDEPMGVQWKKDAAWGDVLVRTLDGVSPELLGELAQGTMRSAAYAVAPWVGALGGELDDAATEVVTEILDTAVGDPSIGRAVLEALSPETREALAKSCAFDVIVASDESPPCIYLCGAWQWLDLSPALMTVMCEEIASWTEVPGAEDASEEEIVAEIVRALLRSPTARASAQSVLASARPVGRGVLERFLDAPA